MNVAPALGMHALKLARTNRCSLQAPSSTVIRVGGPRDMGLAAAPELGLGRFAAMGQAISSMGLAPDGFACDGGGGLSDEAPGAEPVRGEGR